MQNDQTATIADLRSERAMDHGFAAQRSSPARERLTPETIERALATEADLLLDWLDVQSWSTHVQDCSQALKRANKRPGGQDRRTALKAAIDATRRCFIDAPRPGERDAWC